MLMEVDKTTNNDGLPREETHFEPINGVVQPPLLPPPHRPGRVTNQLQPKTQDYSILCDLLPEILSHIFSFLRLEDRKSVRLVSKLWYQYLTCRSITRNEKIVFRMNSRTEDIVEVMQKLNFSNLEFQGLSIIRLPANIWEMCGHHIHSLKFVECHADDKTMKEIIIHCENLISFTWNTDFRREIFCSSQLLDELVHRKIERRKLRSLTLMMCDPLGEIVLNKLFLIYPCVIHFAAETVPHQWLSYFPVSLESLACKRAPKFKQWLEASIARTDQGQRLRHLNAIFDLGDESFTLETFKYFLSQKNLITLTLLLLGCQSQQLMKRITFNILGSCPNLQEFHISFGDDEDDSQFLYLQWEELLRLQTLISKLKFLSLGLRVLNGSSIPLPRAPTTQLFSRNFVLTSLDLRLNSKTSGANEENIESRNLFAALIQQCPQLLHLRINAVTDNILQIIFKNLLKLQTLSTHSCPCTRYGFTGRDASKEAGYSIKRLQQLRNLDIGCIGDAKHIGEIMLEFKLPHLEYLTLDWIVFEKIPEEKLIKISSLIPNLKRMAIYQIGQYVKLITMKKMVNFLKNFKKLYCVSMSTNKNDKFFEDFLSNQVENFFLCPSLRYVWRVGDNLMYYFNPFTKEIERCKHECFNKKFEFYDLVFDNSFLDILPLQIQMNHPEILARLSKFSIQLEKLF